MYAKMKCVSKAKTSAFIAARGPTILHARCVCVLCGGGVPTLVRRVCNHFGTVPARLCRVCGLGWVNFDVFGRVCTFLKVPAGITVCLVWFYGVLDRF